MVASFVQTLPPGIVTNSSLGVLSGWITITDSWSYSSADSPTFVITVPSGATSIYSPGMRIKLTQSSTIKYFIITAVSDTSLTVYGGTDYTLVNAAISDIYFSTQKAPLGFPLDPSKWTVKVTSSTDQSKSSAAISTWYGGSLLTPTGPSISVPIGAWKIGFTAIPHITLSGSGSTAVLVTLSTTNNTKGTDKLTGRMRVSNATVQDGTISLSDFVSLSTKTTYYVNISAAISGSSLDLWGASVNPTVIEAVSVYL